MVTIATTWPARYESCWAGNAEFMAKQECVKKGTAQLLRAARERCKPASTMKKYGCGTTVAMSTSCPPIEWNGVFDAKGATASSTPRSSLRAAAHLSAPSARSAPKSTTNFEDARRQGDPISASSCR